MAVFLCYLRPRLPLNSTLIHSVSRDHVIKTLPKLSTAYSCFFLDLGQRDTLPAEKSIDFLPGKCWLSYLHGTSRLP